MPIALTGIKPTGQVHLGNYLGAIRPALEMMRENKFSCYFFIADYHSLISIHQAKNLQEYCYEVAASWIALGLDPKAAILYRQSDIPEILELNWILNCFTAKGLMNRAHAYKAQVQDNQERGRDLDYQVNMGLYSYPVLMAADILFLNADYVPVGADQLQHLEICRDIAQVMNHQYKKEIFKLPKPLVNKEQELIPGLDGRKMSKSYDNTIPLFLPEKKLQKLINKIVTDSSAPDEPKNPDDSLIFKLFCHFSHSSEQKELRERFLKGMSWGEAKASLFEVINRHLKGPREAYQNLMDDRSQIDQILSEGAEKIRPLAQKNLQTLKQNLGLGPLPPL